MSGGFRPNALTVEEIGALEDWQLLVAACHFGPTMTDCVELDYEYRFDGERIFCVGQDWRGGDVDLTGDISTSDPETALRHYAALPRTWQTAAAGAIRAAIERKEDGDE
jgi:hypothetical protein